MASQPMSDSQAIFALLRGELEKRIDGCEWCDGTNFVFECSEHGHVKRSEVYEVRGTDASGLSHDKCGFNVEYESDNTCPTCTPWRELVKELCWHEWKRDGEYEDGNFRFVCECGVEAYARDLLNIRLDHSHHTNPDLTTAPSKSGSRLLIVDIMDRAGEWEGFVLFNENQSHCRISNRDKSGALRWAMRETDEAWEYCKAEILTDGKYLVPAIRGHLEGRV